jgi:hypothetical protein
MDPQILALRHACGALWLATLSLMTAYMRTQAPAHRYLLARRIAANLGTLQAQDCFGAKSRRSFARLSSRWSETATRLAPTAHESQHDRLGITIRSSHG